MKCKCEPIWQGHAYDCPKYPVKIMKFIKKELETFLMKNPIVMSKALSSGFFGTTYDRRECWSFKDLEKLNSEGFQVNTDLGAWLFNMFKD